MQFDHLDAGLELLVGQYSSAGIKDCNEDAIGIRIPEDNSLVTKGAVAVIADGVSAAEGGKEASETAVTSFLSDYYSTHRSWSVKTSGLKILIALNRWLYSQGQKYTSAEKGFITTFSALILKSASAYIFHVGDSRIYRLRNGQLEQLTRDHASPAGNGQRYLGRALGIDTRLDVDYQQVDVEAGDRFLLTTDGIHDWLSSAELQNIAISDGSCEALSQQIVEAALAKGSNDNLSVQIISVQHPGHREKEDVLGKLTELPFPPPLEKGQIIDDWRVVREIQATSRSEVYLVEHTEDKTLAAMKTPSINYEDDAAYIERFMMEEWIGSRIHSSNVVRVINANAQRQFLYYLTEYIPGPTLAQLLKERTRLPVMDVRNIITQVASGLRALHRKDTLHQDIKPDNIIYTEAGVKILDFGSTFVAGINEINTNLERQEILGTLDYTAPEYKLHTPISAQSDQFSLAMLMYELLTGQHPYGKSYQKAETAKDFSRLTYTPSYQHNPLVPVWMDKAMQKALNLDSQQRYDALSEFVQDIKTPNPDYGHNTPQPLFTRNPLKFWQALSALLLITNIFLLYFLSAK